MGGGGGAEDIFLGTNLGSLGTVYKLSTHWGGVIGGQGLLTGSASPPPPPLSLGTPLILTRGGHQVLSLTKKQLCNSRETNGISTLISSNGLSCTKCQI